MKLTSSAIFFAFLTGCATAATQAPAASPEPQPSATDATDMPMPGVAAERAEANVPGEPELNFAPKAKVAREADVGPQTAIRPQMTSETGATKAHVHAAK